MATTVIITHTGESISVHPTYCLIKPSDRHPSEYWHFSVNVERYRYKNAQPLIRYSAEIRGKKMQEANPPKMIGEEIVIFRSNRTNRVGSEGLGVVNEAHTILQSLLQAIDNGDPVWDVRELL